MIELEQITQQAQTAISEATELSVLDGLRVEYLGKKGQLTGLLKGLGALSAEERPAAGARANDGAEQRKKQEAHQRQSERHCVTHHMRERKQSGGLSA